MELKQNSLRNGKNSKVEKDFLDAVSAAEQSTEWKLRHGYIIVRTAMNEYRWIKKGSSFDIVLQRDGDNTLTSIDKHSDNVLIDENRHLALGMPHKPNPMVIQTWLNYRKNTIDEASICTRQMPVFVSALLIEKHGIPKEVSLAFRTRLMSFGEKGNENPRNKDLMWEPSMYATTRRYICYAPGEMTAIADVASEMLKGKTSAEEVFRLDIEEFKRKLSEKVAKTPISCTGDMALYGRSINKWGLEEYESPLMFGLPKGTNTGKFMVTS